MLGTSELIAMQALAQRRWLEVELAATRLGPVLATVRSSGRPATLVRGLKVAAVVGTILNLLNYGPALAEGTLGLSWALLLNYVVPFCVSVCSSARADMHPTERAADDRLTFRNMEPAMTQARWNGAVLAESGDTVIVDGYHYFPRDQVRMDHLEASEAITRCPWKGTAEYFDLVVGGERNPDAAWHYPAPKPQASHIEDRIAFWKGVEIS